MSVSEKTLYGPLNWRRKWNKFGWVRSASTRPPLKVDLMELPSFLRTIAIHASTKEGKAANVPVLTGVKVTFSVEVEGDKMLARNVKILALTIALLRHMRQEGIEISPDDFVTEDVYYHIKSEIEAQPVLA